MLNPNDDGVSHINVYSKGKTELGRFLSNFTYFPFDVEDDGHFCSVEGYWYWLLTYDDRLRKLSGFQAKQLGREISPEIDSSIYTRDKRFQDNIKSAITIKLHYRKPEIVGLDKSIKFEHYYVYGDKVVDAGYKWILEHIENFRNGKIL